MGGYINTSTIPLTSPLNDPVATGDKQPNMNPYMTNSLYGINQNNLGNYANSISSGMITNYAQNQALQIEQILGTTIAGSGGPTTVTLNFDDQQKTAPPQILAFITIDNTDSTPLPYLEQTFGVGAANAYFYVQAFNKNVQCIVQGFPTGTLYVFTVYVLSQNTLI